MGISDIPAIAAKLLIWLTVKHLYDTVHLIGLVLLYLEIKLHIRLLLPLQAIPSASAVAASYLADKVYIPMHIFASFGRVISTNASFFSLQSSMPIVGFSSSVFS